MFKIDASDFRKAMNCYNQQFRHLLILKVKLYYLAVYAIIYAKLKIIVQWQ